MDKNCLMVGCSNDCDKVMDNVWLCTQHKRELCAKLLEATYDRDSLLKQVIAIEVVKLAETRLERHNVSYP